MTPDTMPMETRIWSQLPVSLLKLLKTGKIPNALLLTGNPGSGRYPAAMAVAMSANCNSSQSAIPPGQPCGTCISCKKTASGMHPDVIEITPVKGSIKIIQIREIAALISVRPHEAGWRMVLIRNSGTMTTGAANALLKMLEEPPAGTFFVLIADALTDLLPTVISRCSHIRFKPLSRNELVEVLRVQYAVEQEQACVAASMADGSIEAALKLINRSDADQGVDWVNRRRWLIQETANLLNTAAGQIPGPGMPLPLAEQVSKDTDLIHESLAIIRSWLRDLAVIRYSPGAIVNSDFRELIEAVSRKFSLQRIISWVDDLHTAETGLMSNTVPRVTLEHLFLKLTLVAGNRTVPS